MATSKDVAKLAGVSHTTVSRAFKKGSSIKPETYNRIMRAAKTLNYAPNSIAASLRARHTKTVGMIIPSADVTLFVTLAQVLERALAKHGYRMIVSFDENNPAQQLNALRTMAEMRVDSIVYLPVPQPDPAAALHWMRSTDIQFVQCITREYQEQCSYLFDDVTATIAGMRHLFEHGHKRILFLGGENRVAGFYQSYEAQGEKPPIPYESLEGLSIPDCRAKVRQLIERHRPTAIFSIADQINIITYGVLMEMRMHVPEDISLLIFDEAFWSTSLGISAIGHPVAGMAKAIVRQILDCAKGDSSEQMPTTTMYVPSLVPRKTVAKNNREEE